MRITSFGVRNYRSITSAKLPLGDLTVLIGPNNEGKSNVLHALVTALRILTEAEFLPTSRGLVRRFLASVETFDWRRDFPVALQSTTPDGASEFVVEFALTDAERSEFRRLVASTLSGNLKLKLSPKRDSVPFEVVIKGPAKRALSARRKEIAGFIRSNLAFQYIPSIRTEAQAMDIAEQMVRRELRPVMAEPKYKRLVEQIVSLQQPVLDHVGAALRDTIREFLPDVKDVRVESRTADAPRLTDMRILVDDGTMTDLAQKGDGIKSLAAIALMRTASRSPSTQTNLVLAVEEPESHLHPDAIHRLRAILGEVARTHQLVITTHSPLLVARDDLTRNVLVRAQHAQPAKSLRQVRELLGVRIADNLVSAYLVLVVEGETDRRIISKLLPEMSAEIRMHLQTGNIAIEWLQGTDKLSFKVGELKRSLCNVHCFLDNDSAAKGAVDRAVADVVLTDAEVNYAQVPGMAQSEIEDLVDAESYRDALNAAFAIALDPKALTATSRKWSERMEAEFLRLGKGWNYRIASEAKGIVADAVDRRGIAAIRTERRPALDALVTGLQLRAGDQVST